MTPPVLKDVVHPLTARLREQETAAYDMVVLYAFNSVEIEKVQQARDAVETTIRQIEALLGLYTQE